MKETAYYTSYIQRERHAMVDRAADECRESLAIPQVAKRLGGYVARLTELLDGIVVPNVHHGVVRMPSSIDTRTPILPVHIHETVFVQPRDLALNVRQRESLFRYYGQSDATAVIDQHDACVSSYGSGLPLPAPAAELQAAYVAHDVTDFELMNGTREQLRTQPTLVLDASRPGYRSPPVLAHELTHVLQLNDAPVVPYDGYGLRVMVEQELEAHHVESQLFQGYGDAGMQEVLIDRVNDNDLIIVNLLFENTRIDCGQPGDTPFQATTARVAQLHRQGLIDVLG